MQVAGRCISLQALYPDIAAEWHHNRYEGQPSDCPASPKHLAWWSIPQRGSWQQVITSRPVVAFQRAAACSAKAESSKLMLNSRACPAGCGMLSILCAVAAVEGCSALFWPRCTSDFRCDCFGLCCFDVTCMLSARRCEGCCLFKSANFAMVVVLLANLLASLHICKL